MDFANASLPAERPGTAAPDALLHTRARVAAAPAIYPPHADVRADWSERAGVRCLELTPPAVRGTLLYLHGGGYRMGDCAGYLGYASALAIRASAKVILPEYRLAPEHPFPAALHDAVRVLTTLGGGGLPLFIGGDSAGGGLAVAALVALGPQGRDRVAGLVLLSPWLDLTLSGETFTSRSERDPMFPPASAAAAAGQYLQGHPADDPLASPLFADPAGFPRTLIAAGSEETLLSDSLRFAERLALGGTTVDARFYRGMNHVWPVIAPGLAETADVMDAIAAFVQSAGT